MSNKSLRLQCPMITIFIVFVTFLISQISSTSTYCPATTLDNLLLYSRSPDAEPVAECDHLLSFDENKMWNFMKRGRENEIVDKRGEEEFFEKYEKRENQEKRDDQSFGKRDDDQKELFDERSNSCVPNCCCCQPVYCDKTPPIVCGGAPSFEGPCVCDETPVILDETPIIVDEEPIIIDEEPIIIDETPIIVDDICDNTPFICDNTPLICDNICDTEYDVGSIRIKNPIRPGTVPLGWCRFGI